MSDLQSEQTRRDAFDLMEQALVLLDSIDERVSATLLDHAIATMKLRSDVDGDSPPSREL